MQINALCGGHSRHCGQINALHFLRIVFNDYSSSYQELLKQAKTCTLKIRWKRQLVTDVYKATHNRTPPYITSLFPPKIVNYDLRSNMPISQRKFQTHTHGYHSLRNEGTMLWARGVGGDTPILRHGREVLR